MPPCMDRSFPDFVLGLDHGAKRKTRRSSFGCLSNVGSMPLNLASSSSYIDAATAKSSWATHTLLQRTGL
ncbi:hypothetical protein A0H81_14477 [Grifola frondosa]|uniref:Uncharacterized protein n=1 Tax=Grifola frondosa TaxID=5627 RepID=A0A1C7LLK3_GRIFR|nr:hypothetical protein A0H81_14477 [Grifola frondosa]